MPTKGEFVLIPGLSPTRAKKLCYYEDQNFTSRILLALVLLDVDYSDKPAVRKGNRSVVQVCITLRVE